MENVAYAPGDLWLSRGRVLVWLAIAVFLLLQFASGFTEAVNWDETALMQRAVAFVHTGELQGGGRPGLAEIVLAPFADGCTNVVTALRGARVLWVFFTFGLLCGVYALVRSVLRNGSAPRTDAFFAVLCLAGIPVFLRWSLHVRTDQPAVMCALWGGVALLASRRKLAWAFAAGFLTAVGALFSQKAIYIGGLTGLLMLLDLWISPDETPSWRALLQRIVLALAGFAGVLLAYRFILPLFVTLPRVATLESGMNVFRYYRSTLGFNVYITMMPTFTPFLIVGMLASIGFMQKKGDASSRRALGGALCVLTLGLAVGLFHAGAFPYFWMTLGIFPAIAAALTLGVVRAVLPDARTERVMIALTVGVFIFQGSVAAFERLVDTQRVQRETLAFVERNFPLETRGYQMRGELACRVDPAPFPVYFMQNVENHFFRDKEIGARNIELMRKEFQERPVVFMVMNQWIRRFPSELVGFWDAHFVTYRDALAVHGVEINSSRGGPVDFEVLKSGHFTWLQPPDVPPAALRIDGDVELQPGEDRILEPGVVRLEILHPKSSGRFVWRLQEGPSEGRQSFFSSSQSRGLGGLRR